MSIDYIKEKINYGKLEVYRNYKLILVAENMKDLKQKIKDTFNEPSKNIRIYIVEYKIKNNDKYPFTILCSQYKITPKLTLIVESDDKTQNILYSQNELDNIGFQKNHLNHIMKAIKNRTIPTTIFSKVTINNVLKK